MHSLFLHADAFTKAMVAAWEKWMSPAEFCTGDASLWWKIQQESWLLTLTSDRAWGPFWASKQTSCCLAILPLLQLPEQSSSCFHFSLHVFGGGGLWDLWPFKTTHWLNYVPELRQRPWKEKTSLVSVAFVLERSWGLADCRRSWRGMRGGMRLLIPSVRTMFQ